MSDIIRDDDGFKLPEAEFTVACQWLCWKYHYTPLQAEDVMRFKRLLGVERQSQRLQAIEIANFVCGAALKR